MRLNYLTKLARRALIVAAGCAAAWCGEYQTVSETTTAIPLPLGELKLTERVVQDGPLPINRFRMHRLRRPGVPNRGPVLLLPALGNSFNGYLTGENGDVANSFAAFFARMGYDVWGYSPRETGIAPGACGGGLDCSPALGWSVQTVLDDASYIRAEIKKVQPGKDPVVGGLSLGAFSALAVVNEKPNDYAGVLAWEGSLVTDDPVVQAHNLGFCQQFQGLVNAGVPVDDQSLPFVKLVAQLAQAAPNDLFAIPVPGFPPGLTNRQAFLLILTAPNPVAPSPRPGFVSAAGDFMSGQLFNSDEARLAANIAAFNDVTANRVVQDLYCSLAGVETKYSANLKQFKKPVLILKAGAGFGPVLDQLPAKLGSKSVTVLEQNSFGHVDHLGAWNHLFVLELPVAAWLGGVL